MKSFLHNRVFIYVTFLLVHLIFIKSAFGAAVSWDGGGGVDNNWSNVLNWSGDQLPTGSDDVTISGPVTVIVNGNALCKSLIVNGGNSDNTTTISFAAGSQLTITNALTIGNTGGSRLGSVDMTNGGTLICNNIVVRALGTWTPGSGTVEFRGKNNNNIPTQFSTFNNLTIGAENTTANIPLNIGGSLTISTGATFDAGPNNSTQNHNVGGNWINNGTFNAENGTITFNGTSAQVIGGTATTTFNNLTINKTAGGVSLDHSVSVNGVLNLANGQLTTSATNLLTLNSSATVTGASNNSFVNGPMKKVGFSGTEFTFPVGKNGKYVPIGVSGAATDDFIAEYVPTLPSGSITASGLLKVSTCEYWNLNRTAGTTNVTVKLYWDGDNACSGPGYIQEPSTIVVAQSNNESPNPGTWQTYGGVGTGSAGDGSVSWATTPVSSTSRFTLGSTSPLNVLPVHFSNVRVSEKAAGAQIDFTNLTESDVDFYEVERSTDGKTFGAIKRLSPEKNDYGKAAYSYLDASVKGGRYLYRVKAVEVTGKTIYSSVASIILGSKSAAGIIVHASGYQVNAQIIGLPAGKYRVQIFSASGQPLSVQDLNHAGGSFSLATPLNNARAGLFIYNISGPVKMQKKFIVQ